MEGITERERLAAAETKIAGIDSELLRIRTRLHELESDRATIQLLLDGQQMLTARVESVSNSIEEVSKRTAEKVVALFYADKSQIAEVRASQRRDRLKVALQSLSVGIAIGGFIVSMFIAR